MGGAGMVLGSGNKVGGGKGDSKWAKTFIKIIEPTSRNRI
jgi:hypothetical protein